MKNEWTVECQCGAATRFHSVGTQKFESTVCGTCGNVLVPLDSGAVYARVFNRGYSELKGGDNTLAILLAAMSTESYLGSLFLKWKEVDLLASRSATDMDKDAWESEFRKFGNAGERFDKVALFLTQNKFDDFIQSDAELCKFIAQRHSDLQSNSPKQYFLEKLFRKRNRILHAGAIDFNRTEAAECVELSRTLLSIFTAMDRKRLAELDAQTQSSHQP